MYQPTLKNKISFLLFFIWSFQPIEGSSRQDKTRLHEDLFKNYSRFGGPIDNTSMAINVSVQPDLLAILGLDQASQTLKTTMFFTVSWHDDGLTWTPSSYGGIEYVNVLAGDIWTPDLTVINSVDLHSSSFENAMITLVFWNGKVIWTPAGFFETTCKMDISKYPFDEHICTVEVVQMGLQDTKIDMYHEFSELQLLLFFGHGEWDVVNTKVKLKTTQYALLKSIETVVHLKRRSQFYVLKIVFPILLLAILSVGAFKIPVESGERMGYSVAIFLTFSVVLDSVSDSMPSVSEQVSFLQVFLSIELTLSAVTIVLSIISIRIYKTGGESPIGLKLNTILCKVQSCLKRRRIAGNITDDQNADQNEHSIPTGKTEIPSSVHQQFDDVMFWVVLLINFALFLWYVIRNLFT